VTELSYAAAGSFVWPLAGGVMTVLTSGAVAMLGFHVLRKISS
jgi:hypothetical protein